jgi:bacterioferritin
VPSPGDPSIDWPSAGELSDRALLDLLDGPVTPSNLADIPVLVVRLNRLLATAIVSWLFCEQYGCAVSGVHAEAVAQLLLRCADHARTQIRGLAERISALGGTPVFDPDRVVAQSYTRYREFTATDCTGVVAETLFGTRVVIQLCQEYARWVGDGDATTRRLLEAILERSEADAARLRRFLRAQ